MNRVVLYSFINLVLISGSIMFIKNACADNNYYNMTNTVLAPVRASGSACIADNFGLSGAIYNPASLDLFRYPESPRFAFFINPTGAVALVRDKNELSANKHLDGVDWLNYAGIVFKGIGFSLPTFTAILLLTEPLQNSLTSSDQKMDEMFTSKYVLDCNYDVLALKLKLADQVAIGASGFLFSAGEKDAIKRSHGTSYGVQINPNTHVSVGVVYYNFPTLVSHYMLEQNRIIDETINIGINIRPYNSISFNLDAYNVSEDNKKYTRELHIGLLAVPMDAMAIRAGMYREQDSQLDVYSLGLGLINTNWFFSTDNSFSYNDFAINYSVQFWQKEKQNFYHHYLTFLLRF